jgi:hypothetical protein
MNAQAKPAEPSMEEILASIRRIIADDEVKPAEEAAVEAAPIAVEAALPEAASPVDLDEDVLDLGAEASLIAAPVAEAPVTSVKMPAAPAVMGDGGDIDFLENAEPERAPQIVAPPPQAFVPPPMPAFVPHEPSHAPAAPFDMAQLLSDQTSSAVNNAFGHLAHTVLSNNARTLEDLVKDMLKPMLKTWLDDNLPTMVERLVRAEIERVARGGRH